MTHEQFDSRTLQGTTSRIPDHDAAAIRNIPFSTVLYLIPVTKRLTLQGLIYAWTVLILPRSLHAISLFIVVTTFQGLQRPLMAFDPYIDSYSGRLTSGVRVALTSLPLGRQERRNRMEGQAMDAIEIYSV